MIELSKVKYFAHQDVLANTMVYAKSLIMDFATIKRIAESDIRVILKAKKTDISITPMWVDFCSCGTAVEVDKIKLINGNVYLSGKFPSGKEVDKPFGEMWDIHNFAEICREIGV